MFGSDMYGKDPYESECTRLRESIKFHTLCLILFVRSFSISWIIAHYSYCI